MGVRVLLSAFALLACCVFADDTLSLLQTFADRARPDRAHGHHWRRYAESSIVRLLDFSKADIVFNNLGGQGPDRFLPTGEPAPEQLRFRNLVRDQPIDLMIVADEGYQAYNPRRNGILGANGQINARSGTSAGLTFTFVEEGTNTEHTMPEFYVTFSDIDERHGGTEVEKITVHGFDQYYTNDDLKLEDPDYIANGNDPVFMSSDYGNYSDNDLSPDSPDAVLLSHSVTYRFMNKASFHATFIVDSARHIKKGRNVLFSGISQLVFCKDPSTYLHFEGSEVTANNLGGMGPIFSDPHEIRWSEIAVASDGTSLDLVVTSDEGYGYLPTNASQNGLHGDFGIINLFCGQTHDGSEAYLTFTVMESGTNTSYQLDAFAFTVFDFDTGKHEQQVEYVDVRPTTPGFDAVGSGYASYIVTKSTEIAISSVTAVDDPNGHDLGKQRFSATKHGTEADNPSSSQMLAREVADKSVVFTFRKTSSFQMTLGITPTGYDSSRNFMFAGQDMYLMCD